MRSELFHWLRYYDVDDLRTALVIGRHDTHKVVNGSLKPRGPQSW